MGPVSGGQRRDWGLDSQNHALIQVQLQEASGVKAESPSGWLALRVICSENVHQELVGHVDLEKGQPRKPSLKREPGELFPESVDFPPSQVITRVT